jgi:protein SCO1/2
MNPRLRLTMMAGATIVLLGILAFLLLSDPNAGSSQLPATRFAGAIRPESPPARFALRDQDGKRITASGLRGQPVIVAFLYSTCENECPTIAQQIRGALDRLGRDVPVVAVSVDPAGDTPRSAQRFLAAQQLGGRMNFLLGSDKTLQPVWREFGIQPQEDGREHTAIVVLLDASGRQRIGFPLSELTPEGIAHDVRVLQREAAAQGGAQ